MTQPYTITEPTETDREPTNNLMWRALYPTESQEDLPFFHQPPNTWALLAKDDDVVAATMSVATDFENHIRGASLPIAGVWGVATQPSHRRRGIMRAVFQQGFQKMKDGGQVLAVLDPFSVMFYQKFGYANAEQRTLHHFASNLLRFQPLSQNLQARLIRDEAELPKIATLGQSMSRFGSRIFHSAKGLKLDEKSHLYLIERQGQPVGTAKFNLDKMADGQEGLSVSQVYYASDEVLPALINLIANFAGQCDSVRWLADAHIPLHHFVTERADLKSQPDGAMMMRVIDLKGYCQAIRVPETATQPITLHLQDADCPWNTGCYRLTPDAGQLALETLPADSPVDIQLSAQQLSQAISGLTPATVLHSLGQFPGSPETARRLTALFPEDRFESYIRF